jgi:hypothetical protein
VNANGRFSRLLVALLVGAFAQAGLAACTTSVTGVGAPGVQLASSAEGVPTAAEALASLLGPETQSDHITETLREVGSDLAVGEAVNLLLQDAEWVAGHGLIASSGASILAAGGGALVSQGGAHLISDAGVRLTAGAARFTLASEDAPPTDAALVDAWRALPAAERRRKLDVHVQREARALESAREAIASRAGAYRAAADLVATRTPEGLQLTRQTIETPHGPVVVERVEDVEGVTIRLRQAFRGVLGELVVDAERTRHVLPDGTLRVEARTSLGQPGAARKLTWRKRVAADGRISGNGERSVPSGWSVALAAEGNVAAVERLAVKVDDAELSLERGAGRSQAKVSVAGGKGKRGEVAVDLPALGSGPQGRNEDASAGASLPREKDASSSREQDAKGKKSGEVERDDTSEKAKLTAPKPPAKPAPPKGADGNSNKAGAAGASKAPPDAKSTSKRDN